MSEKHVLMVVNTYAPDDPRVKLAAPSLTNMGYRVRLIGAARQRDEPVATHQQIQDVETIITPMLASVTPIRLIKAFWQLLTGRIGDSVVASSHQRTTALSFLFFNLWVFRIGIRSKADIIHCHDLSPLPAGWLLSRLKRIPLIYDAHENVPTMYVGRKGRFLTRLEKVLIPRVSAVISAGKRLADVMPERGARHVVYIGNWKRLEDYVPDNKRMDAVRQQYGITGDSIVISYLGTIDPTREIHILLEAVRQSPDVVLLIGGRGLLQDDVITAAQGTPNIHWLGWVDSSEIPLYTFLADAIYSVRNDRDFPELNYIAPAPHKLFESFAAGRIVIAKRGVNEMGDILEELQAGILLDEVTPKTLIAAFEQLKDPESRSDLEQKALKAREQYNWKVAEERLAQLYAFLLEDRTN